MTAVVRWVTACVTIAMIGFALVDEVREDYPALGGGGVFLWFVLPMLPAVVYGVGVRRWSTTVTYGLVLVVATAVAWLPPPMYSVGAGGGMEYLLVPPVFLGTLVTSIVGAVQDRRDARR